MNFSLPDSLVPLPMSPLSIGAAVLALLGVVLVVAGLVALFRARPVRFALRTLAGLLLIAIGSLAGMIALGMQGYDALTREEVAAHIVVQPTGAQRFVASVRFPEESREARFELAGDEIYIDAHILKWKPVANILGLHTAYELARISGRYREVEAERTAARTVYRLRQHRAVDLFTLRQRHPFLGRFFDAEYGSATFVPVTRRAEYEVRVSPTGLLMREVAVPGG